MKCLIIQPMHEAGFDALQTAGITPVLSPSPDMQVVADLIPDFAAAITRDAGFNAAAFAAGKQLRVVVIHGTGYDPVDMTAAARAGVIVANTPGENARSVAELAVGLAIATARRIPSADRQLRAGGEGFRESARFTELSGKTALIVGWGAIGRETGRMLEQAFGMRILVHSPRAMGTGVDMGAATPVRRLADGLAQADLVSLHTPLRDATRNLLDAAAFAAMKSGAILVNTARAGLVDETALDAALTSGHLGGAGLDMCSDAAPTGPLARHDNVIFTPHVGATTEDALRRVALAAANVVITTLQGQRPATILNPEVWRSDS